MKQNIIILTLVASCTTIEEPQISLRPCDPTGSTTEIATSSSGGSSSTSESSGGSSSDSGTVFDCPSIADGDVVFDLGGGISRTAYVIGSAQASSTSTALVYWHGTYEGNTVPLSGALPYGVQDMFDDANGLIIMPRADAEATSRTNNPFPWWIVCGQTDPSQCGRNDDFVLAEAIAACVVEQGLADPDRLTTAGMSAGGIMASHVIERGIGSSLRLAAAISWSGGQQTEYQPTVPASEDTAVFVLHGGTSDVYCGVGQPAGSCSGYTPYSFVAPSEDMASDLDAEGNFAFVCNHGSGHNAVMGPQGAEFLLAADAGGAHPWQGFPFGVDGYGSWPGMSGGTNWMLRFYGDCHDPL